MSGGGRKELVEEKRMKEDIDFMFHSQQFPVFLHDM